MPKTRGSYRSNLPLLETLEERALFSTYTVTNTNDSGTGSLRQAIKNANAHLGADVIAFNIAGGGQRTISPLSGLPGVTDPVTLDATTQPGYVGKPLIEIRGDKAGTASINGLRIDSGSSTIKGFVINRFSGFGIFLYGKGGNAIKGNWIGTDNTGTLDAGNKQFGIFVGSSGNTIGGGMTSSRNVVSGNDGAGIKFYGSAASHNTVVGNYIGTNASGTGAVPNGIGVHMNSAPGNTIGGTASYYRNVISGNADDGVLVSGSGASGNTILGNYIGTNTAGSGAVGNHNFAVEISQPNNTLGGTVSGSRNVISGNVGDGVALFLSSANNCKVQGNYIGLDASGTRDLGNTVDGLIITDGAYNNVIGGSTSAARNVISGNDGRGIGVFSGSHHNTIQGNYIGLNAAGKAGIGNALGINLISTAGGGNVVSYNVVSGNKQGLMIFVSATITGNILGKSADGLLSIANGWNGTW